MREGIIDKLLVFSNSELEASGSTISNTSFGFAEREEDFVNFLQRHPEVRPEDLVAALNVCLSRGYFENSVMGGERHSQLRLTEDGQGRAISVEAARHAPVTAHRGPGDIHIGTFNASGPTQVGHHNLQNVESAIATLIQQIDKAEASEEEKRGAKERLLNFLKHPLTTTLLGAGAGALARLAGGS